MSLLQEALKRKEQDESQRKAEARAAASVLGLPTGESAQAQEEKNEPAEPTRIRLAGQPSNDEKAAGPEQPPSGPARPAEEPAKQAATAAEPAAPAIPAQSMPVAAAPDAGAPHPYRRTASRLWIGIGVVAVIIFVVMGVAGSIIIYRLFSGFKTGIAKQIEHNIKTAAVATGDITMTAGKITPSAIPLPLGSTAGPPRLSAEATQGVAAAVAALQAAATGGKPDAVAAQPAASVERKPAPIKTTPVKLKKAPAPAVKWPALKLTGILRGSGSSDSTAHINGKMVGAGQTVEGVTVVAIQSDQVLLKYENEMKTLRVGAMLY